MRRSSPGSSQCEPGSLGCTPAWGKRELRRELQRVGQGFVKASTFPVGQGLQQRAISLGLESPSTRK